jgi:dihydrolipoyl dehydrogenase
MVVGELAEAVELLVVGGGPGGYAAAIRAGQLGRQVTLIERGGSAGLGGACLQVGCIPSKALIELAQAAANAREFERMGLRAEGISVSLEQFQGWRQRVCRGLARGVAELLQAAGVNVVHGEARFNRPDRVAVRTPADAAIFFEFEQAIIATGGRSRELPGLPFDGRRVLDPTAALALTEVPEQVVVVGAGYIGVELATALRKLGAAVTIVEARDRILPAFDAALAVPVARRLRRLGVHMRLVSSAQGLAGEELVLDTAHGEERLAAPLVVITAGRIPNTDQLGLAAAGVAVRADGRIDVGGDMRAERTPSKGPGDGSAAIAAIGDVVAGPLRAHKATAQGVVAAEALSGSPSAYEPAATPMVVFSDPEIATAGLGEDAARQEGMDVRVASFPMAASGRAATLGAREGFTRLVTDAATDRVVGVQIVGPRASELAAGATLAVEMMASPADLAGTLHPHPTISEGLREAAEMLLGRPINVAGRLTNVDAIEPVSPFTEGRSR